MVVQTKLRSQVQSEGRQPYDITLKGLFEANPLDMLQYVTGSSIDQAIELSHEALKPPLRIDRGYEVCCNNKMRIVHVELETDADVEIVERMLEYFGILFRKHKKPIRSVIMLPFRTRVPESPLHITDEDGEILIYHFRVVRLYEEDVRLFMRTWPTGLYALTPAMKNADYAALSLALDEMKAFFKRKRAVLRTQLLWFHVFLQRTDTVSEEDREKIMQKLQHFDSLLEQSAFVQKKMAEGEERGKAIGKEIGRVQEKKKDILRCVQLRFPHLDELAQQKVQDMGALSALNELFDQLVIANDEQAARAHLEAAGA